MRSNPTYPGWTFDEGQSLELGAELLAANSEAELDRFLSGVLRRAAGAVRRRLQPQVAQALGGLLKARCTGFSADWESGGVAEEQPGPGQLAEAAGRILGVEMEGLSPRGPGTVAAQQMCNSPARRRPRPPPSPHLAPDTARAAGAGKGGADVCAGPVAACGGVWTIQRKEGMRLRRPRRVHLSSGTNRPLGSTRSQHRFIWCLSGHLSSTGSENQYSN